MRIAIIQFPGSNCEAETMRAVKQAGMEPVEFLWNEDRSKLVQSDGFVIVGGFSYEDRSRSGIIAALDPVMEAIAAEAKKGKPVLGICNGAQILVETGLVPGIGDNDLAMTLAINRRVKNGKVLGTGFYNNWVSMKLDTLPERSAFTLNLKKDDVLRVPVAHGEGRFLMDDALLHELINHNLTTFRYSDGAGQITDDFPVNPNGAMYNLAAVTNITGNVMAMMPHPERTAEGQPIFESMREYIKATAPVTQVFSAHGGSASGGRPDNTITYQPKKYELHQYTPNSNSIQITTSLIITDNESATVENTLRQLGIYVRLERNTHWEISGDAGDDRAFKKKILDTGVLFNTNKEYVTGNDNFSARSCCILVRDRDNIFGSAMMQTLASRGLTEVKDVKKSTLWKISVEGGSIDTVVDYILDTHILFNPFGQECYIYTTAPH